MSEQHIILHIIAKSKWLNGFCYLGYDIESNRILRPLASVDSSTARGEPFTKTELYERKAYKFTYYSSAQENLPKPHGTEDLIVTSAEEVPMEITWDDIVETLFSMASPKLRSDCEEYISSQRSGRITKYYISRRTNCSSVGILLTRSLTFYSHHYKKYRVKASVNASPTIETENGDPESPASEEDAAQGQEQITPSTSNNNKRQYNVAFSDDSNGEPLDEDFAVKKRVIESEVVEENKCTNPLISFSLAESDINESITQKVVPTEIKETHCESTDSTDCAKVVEVMNSDENIPSHFKTAATELQENETQGEYSDDNQLQNSSISLLKSSEQGKPNVKPDQRSEIPNVELITESPFSKHVKDWPTTYDFPYTAPQIPSSNNLDDETVEKLLILSMGRPGTGQQPDNCFLIAVGVIERSETTESP